MNFVYVAYAHFVYFIFCCSFLHCIVCMVASLAYCYSCLLLMCFFTIHFVFRTLYTGLGHVYFFIFTLHIGHIILHVLIYMSYFACLGPGLVEEVVRPLETYDFL